MIAELVPTVVDLVENQIPEALRTQNNSQFIALLKHYYAWLTATGQPTDFIQNILSYRDIDMTNPMFRQHLISSLLNIIPSYTKADKTLLTKHLVDFLKAKGSVDSFKFIMNAIYGEDISIEWNSNKLFRASSNEYSRNASLAIESTALWENIIGSKIVQTFPSPASAIITDAVSTIINGVYMNWLTLDSKSVIGTFTPGGKVESVWNTINRAWFREIYYYEPLSFTNHNLVFTASFEESRPYENMIVKQLNSTFRAVVSTFVYRQQETGRTRVSLMTSNESGTFVDGNQLYIFPAALENTLYTNANIEYGIVSNSIVDVNIINPGVLYTPGQPILFQGGSGESVEGYIADTTTGGIDTINILNKGYGYSVGDSLRVIDSNAVGSGASVIVSSIDGIDGKISTISELNTLSIVDGGSGFIVDDELEIVDGTSVFGEAPIRVKVTSVDSSWLFKGISIVSSGSGYPLYSKVSLIDSSTLQYISGFAATPTFNSSNGITSITTTSIPTISTESIRVIVNGYGATATTSIGEVGDITHINSTNIGINYIDPVVTIIGNGVGAIAIPILVDGTITAFTLISGGVGYTTASVVISERHGSGFSSNTLIQNQSTGSGSITDLSILSRGLYTKIPKCFNNRLTTKVGSGVGAVISMDMRLKSLSIDNNGHYYKTISTSVSGNGSGAILIPHLTSDVLTSISVIDGGSSYSYNTTITCPPSQDGAVGTILTPTIVNGVIKSISCSGGSGYTSEDLTNLHINAGTVPLLTTSVSGNGSIVGYSPVNTGFGYYSQEEIPPLSISTIGDGIGAMFLPSLDSSGTFISVKVINGGNGYSITSTITVSGGNGIGAVLKPVIFNGKITDVIVQNPGFGYRYGTSAMIIGDGNGAEIIPIVETGITSVEIVNGGLFYDQTIQINVTDQNVVIPLESRAEIIPTVVNGVITDLAIVKKGSGYINPVITVTGPGISAVLTASAKRYISSLNVTNKGFGYTYAELYIVGDGFSSTYTLNFDKMGSIDSSVISNVGSGITSTPVITITDVSNFGSVSGVKILSQGAGYHIPPILVLDNKYNTDKSLKASGTKFTCYGSTIGGVKKIMFKHNGAHYNDLPTPIFPFVAVLNENAAFKIGETVITKSGTYRDLTQTVYTTMENGDIITLEDDSRLLQDIDDTFFETGVKAIVNSIDFDRNIIELSMSSDMRYITTEDDIQILSENGIGIVSQDSGTFQVGDVIIGLNSNAMATIGHSYRGNGTSVAGGNGWTGFSFTNDTGKLNSKLSVIADNNRYQDYAYVVKAGIALSGYEELLKSTVHPAGYAMFGDIETHTMVDLNIFNEIGYNTIATILYIISIHSIYQSGTEWNSVAALYGDLVKFKYKYMPISNIAQYQVRQVSDVTFENYNEYVGASVITPDISKWNVLNNGQMLSNTNIAPNGSTTMYSLADTSAISISGFYNTTSCTIGDILTFEIVISEQTTPDTMPRIAIGNDYIDFDPSSGNYTSSSNCVMDVTLLAQYWYVRIKTTATSSTIIAQILPSFSFTSAPGVSNVAAIGRIEATNIFVKNITGLNSYRTMLHSVNSFYVPKNFFIASTEAQITIS